MPRLQSVEPTATTGSVRISFDGVLRGKHLNMFKGLANSPAALEAYLAFAAALNKTGLNAAQREVIALTLAEANRSEYCTTVHTQRGIAAGLTLAQTIEARKGQMKDPRLNALSKLTLAMREKHGHVSDHDLAGMREAGFSDGDIAEAVAVYAFNTYTNYFNHVNQTVVDLPPAPALA